MEWTLQGSAWLGLVTLLLLELNLGVDHLRFIGTINGAPPDPQRQTASRVSLLVAWGLSMLMLIGISQLLAAPKQLMTVGSIALSWHQLLFISAGFWLVLSATSSLHNRLDEGGPRTRHQRSHSKRWQWLLHIGLSHGVFVLNSVVTALGLVDAPGIMAIAITLSSGILLFAPATLRHRIAQTPSILILCLGLLLMIGFSLVVQGFGYAVPKNYLYAAIIFSFGIEGLNQLARRNVYRRETRRPLRERTAEGILRMLGRELIPSSTVTKTLTADTPTLPAQAFEPEERNMVSGVLRLADRHIHSMMTPRADISWINIHDSADQIRTRLSTSPHGFFPVCENTLDNILGIARAKDLIGDILQYGSIRRASIRQPILVHDSIRPLDLMETLRNARGQVVIVIDEFGAVAGLVTAMDIFEAIAGDFPDEDETPDIVESGPNQWIVDGGADLYQLEQTLHLTGLQQEDQDFSTLAGLLLDQFGHLPKVGASLTLQLPAGALSARILDIQDRRIVKVLLQLQH